MGNFSLSEQQRLMHKNLFDKIKNALSKGFYLEAIFLEYSAIEGRLEVLAGVLNLPCNKLLDATMRRKIKISTRIECLKKSYQTAGDIFCNTYLDNVFWKDIKKWIDNRNMYMHGLLKDATLYNNRLKEVCELAETGYNLVNLIYKETTRMRNKQHKMNYEYVSNCCKGKCDFLKIE